LVSSSETNSLVAIIKDGVVLSDEDITQDETVEGKVVHSHDTQQARAEFIEDVIIRGNFVGISTDVEEERGVLGDILAVRLGRDDSKDLVDQSGRSDNQRSTSINNTDESLVATHRLVTNTEIVKANNVVSFVEQRIEFEVSLGILGVVASQNQFTSFLAGVLGQEEGESGVLDQTLLDEEVEDGRNVIFRDSLVGHAEDTASLSGSKVGRNLSHHTEINSLDIVTTKVDSFNAESTSDVTLTIRDDDLGSVLFVSGGLAGVIFGVIQAGKGKAALSGNPQVGRTSVEDDNEVLSRGTDSDGSVELSIQEVGDGNTVFIKVMSVSQRDVDFSINRGLEDLRRDQSKSGSNKEKSNEGSGSHYIFYFKI